MATITDHTADRFSAAAINLKDARQVARQDRPEAPDNPLDRLRQRDTLAGPDGMGRELVARCSIAASLTSGNHSHIDRDDVAAAVAAKAVGAGALHALLTNPRWSVSRLCGDARDAYDRLDRWSLELAAHDVNETPDLLSASSPGLDSIEDQAETDAIAADHTLDAVRDLAARLDLAVSPHGLPSDALTAALYAGLRAHLDETDADHARHLGIKAGAFESRRNRGADILRGLFSASDLLDAVRQVMACQDFTRAARHRTHLLKQDERTEDGAAHDVARADLPEQDRAEPTVWTPELRRDALRWIRAEYRARMTSISAPQDRTPALRKQTTTSTGSEALQAAA